MGLNFMRLNDEVPRKLPRARETVRPSSPLTDSCSSGYATAQLPGFGTLSSCTYVDTLGNSWERELAKKGDIY